MAQLRPGGLALIIKSTFPENLMKMVITERFDITDNTWLVIGNQLKVSKKCSQPVIKNSGWANANTLMPIDPNEELIIEEYQIEKSPS